MNKAQELLFQIREEMMIAKAEHKGNTIEFYVKSQVVKKKMQNTYVLEFTKKGGKPELFNPSNVDEGLRLASKLLGIEVKRDK